MVLRRSRSRRSRQREVKQYLERLGSRAYLLEGCKMFYRGVARDPQYWVIRRFLDNSVTNHDDKIGALALFLTNWNWMKYARTGYSMKEVENAIERAVGESKHLMVSLRGMTLGTLDDGRFEGKIRRVFWIFARKERLIGSTGASKALHALRPELFLPWDSKIQAAYHRLHPGYWPTRPAAGEQRCPGVDRMDVCYGHFMCQFGSVAERVGTGLVIRNRHPANRFGFSVFLTKAIDECNYRRWTDEKPW